jgi:hypothetical protein
MSAEKFITHRVVNCKALNMRESPSINALIVGTLDCDQLIEVVAESHKKVKEVSNRTGNAVEITWVKMKCGEKRYYLSSGYIEAIPANALEVVYGAVVEVKAKHESGAKTLAQIISQKRTTCSTSASVYLQQIGCLNSGVIVSHTKAVKNNILSKKSTIEKSITNSSKLKKCKIVRIGKKYSAMNAKYKKAGVVYIQDSNVCCCVGDGYIFSTNEGGAQYRNGHYFNDKVNSGYPFNSYILYAIVPEIIA